MNRIAAWSLALILAMSAIVCAPAVMAEEIFYLPYYIHGFDYQSMIDENDQYFTRGSCEQYLDGYGDGDVGIGPQLSSMIEWNRDIYNEGDLLYELLVRQTFYHFSTISYIQQSLIDSVLYCWEDSNGDIVISDEYYLFLLEYLEGEYRVILFNLYGEMDGGETLTACTVLSSSFEDIEDQSDFHYVGDLVAADDLLLKESPEQYAAPTAAIYDGAQLTNCYANSDGWVYCEYNGMRGYISQEYVRQP